MLANEKPNYRAAILNILCRHKSMLSENLTGKVATTYCIEFKNFIEIGIRYYSGYEAKDLDGRIHQIDSRFYVIVKPSDTFLRFLNQPTTKIEPIQISEILFSERVHEYLIELMTESRTKLLSTGFVTIPDLMDLKSMKKPNEGGLIIGAFMPGESIDGRHSPSELLKTLSDDVNSTNCKN